MSSFKTIKARIADTALQEEFEEEYGVDHVLVSPDVVAVIDLVEEKVLLLCLLDLAAMSESEDYSHAVTALRLLGEGELTIPLKNLDIPMVECDKQINLRITNAIGARLTPTPAEEA